MPREPKNRRPPASPPAVPKGSGSTAFLLAQIGAHAAARFGERISALGLTRPHAGILRVIAALPGLTQQALGASLQILPSRLVILLDELQRRGLIERRPVPSDRRAYALHLTAAGQQAMEQIGRVAREHDEAVCAALSHAERQQLDELLRRIAGEQGLAPGIHPGYRWLGRKPRSE